MRSTSPYRTGLGVSTTPRHDPAARLPPRERSSSPMRASSSMSPGRHVSMSLSSTLPGSLRVAAPMA